MCILYLQSGHIYTVKKRDTNAVNVVLLSEATGLEINIKLN